MMDLLMGKTVIAKIPITRRRSPIGFSSFVSDLLKDPERIRAGIDALMEQERAHPPGGLAKVGACGPRRWRGVPG
jgi:hypothetical protein